MLKSTNDKSQIARSAVSPSRYKVSDIIKKHNPPVYFWFTLFANSLYGV